MNLTVLKNNAKCVLFIICLTFSSISTAQANVVDALSAAKSAYDAYKFLNDLNSVDVHERILDAIDRVSDEIQEAMGSIATAEVESCADAILYDFENFLNYNEDVQQDFARGYLHCLTRAIRLIDEPSTQAAHIDRLGWAFNVVAVVTLFVSDYLDFHITGVHELFRSGNQKILAELKPHCRLSVLEPESPEQLITCRAYNGDSASEHVFPDFPFFEEDKERVEDLAGNNTSYIIAKEMLTQRPPLFMSLPFRRLSLSTFCRC